MHNGLEIVRCYVDPDWNGSVFLSDMEEEEERSGE
jgi:hypothetical protein